MLFEYDCKTEITCADMDLGYALEHIQDGNYGDAVCWIEFAIQSVDSVIRRTK